ncbi:GLPGLI family protein [Cellulophaga lytica]|uniref:GLPGLI family protein n=1 Tax=Cellulophaga lytica TaxID=979 RepID=UPI000B5C83A8|nr:GLPGLI family protein [Cellulophaga lytica]SNQ42722.1 conserved exported hypothetical protein [Cellulophaga lytica]
MQKIVLLLIFFISVVIYSQNSTIKYTVSTNKALGDNSKDNTLNDVNNALLNTTLDFQLTFSTKESFYELDELLDDGINSKIASIFFGASKKYYTNVNTKECLLQALAYGDLYLVSLEKPNWVLKKENKKIGKYTCYKAVTEYTVVNSKGNFIKKVTAWYTPQIKGSFGPRGYFGLPGTILELQDDKILISATEINLLSKKKNEIKKPIKGKKISKKEYDNLNPPLRN